MTGAELIVLQRTRLHHTHNIVPEKSHVRSVSVVTVVKSLPSPSSAVQRVRLLDCDVWSVPSTSVRTLVVSALPFGYTVTIGTSTMLLVVTG